MGMKTLAVPLAALLLAACSAVQPPPAPAAAAPAVSRIDGAAARQMVRAGARLVDVRTREEYEAGHVEGAMLLPYEQIEARAAEVGPREAPVVVYCASGRRSAIAAATLRRLGFTHVHDLGPMDAWNAPPGRSSQ